ncbi:MAG TPA: ABC transporter permease [Candidatus Limnocylindria bacterium]|nr:ABC transporter permease [Candidatus Limnocylindria bacterium]
MNWLKEMGRRVIYLFQRRRLDEDLAEEMRLHVELRAAEHREGGASGPDAEAAAIKRFGNATRLTETSHEAWGWGWLDSLAQDWRYGWRTLRSSPGFTLTALLSLALGIGANTAVFSIMNAVMLKSLPVEDPQRLVRVRSGGNGVFTNPQWEEIRNHQQAFSGMLAYGNTRFDLAMGGESQPARGMFASGDFFRVLGVPALLGRVFTSEDDRRGGGESGPVAVISHRFWETHFHGDTNIIGKTFHLNRLSFQIIGITPAWFTGLEVDTAYDIAIPLGCKSLMDSDVDVLAHRSYWWLCVLARLPAGATPQQAATRLNILAPEIMRATLPGGWDGDGKAEYLRRLFDLQPAATGFSGIATDYRQALFTLMAVTALVLLIACANIANLMLARAAARQREITIRLAIGAGRRRLIRQLLAESLLLALLGIPGGLLLAHWGAKLLVSLIATSGNPLEFSVSPDLSVFAFTTTMAIATGFLFGLAPALLATRVAPNEVLKKGGHGGHGRSRFRLGQALVAGQIALSLLLLVGAGLFIATLRNLGQVPAGFRSQNVLLLEINTQGLVPKEARNQLYNGMLERFRAIPGVDSAASVALPPLIYGVWNETVEPEGYPGKPGQDTLLYFNQVSSDYLKTLGTPLLYGRDFDSRDTLSSPKTMIITETAARNFFRATNPIGKTITVEGSKKRYEIIGVIADVKYRHLRESTLPVGYTDMAQEPDPWPSMNFAVRAGRGGASVIPALRAAVEQTNPALSVEFRDFELQVRETMRQERMIAMLSAFFGGLALLLAIIGLYGVTSYAVAQRQGEIGIRMALGARRAAVVSLVLRDVIRILLMGGLVGSIAAIASGRLIASLLYGIRPTDPATLIISIMVLGVATLVAGYLPARRAARLNPMAALREQ